VRLRRRSWGGEVVNGHETKKRVSPTDVLETERQVSNALYESLLQQADPYRSTIRKTRRSFIWRGQYFEIDTFHEPVSNLMILQTRGVVQQEDVNFPPFIKVLEDITGNKQFYNYNIALRR
jgi:CYTH domain-containing protein